MTSRVDVGIGVLGLLLLAGPIGCNALAKPEWQTNATGQWSLELLAVVEGFNVPASAYVDDSNGNVYVSSVATDTSQYWADDAAGFISRLAPGGAIDDIRWLNSNPNTFLHAPKGLCILANHLYVADNKRILRVPLQGETRPTVIHVPDAMKLSDLATDGQVVYASDGATSKIYRLDGERIAAIDAPQGVAGITFVGDNILAVTSSIHDVYTVDPTGKDAPVAMGLAEHFAKLCGIEVLYDGTLLVTDSEGGALYAVTRDGKDVKVLIRLDAPGDIGLDRQRGLLYVPQLLANRVCVYRLLPDTGAASLSAQ